MADGRVNQVDDLLSRRVALRALGLGTFAGTVVGFLTPAFGSALYDGWGSFAAGLILGGFGMIGGAFVGFVCALIPAMVLGTWATYFQQHLWSARLCAGAVAGALTIGLTVHAFLTTSGYTAAVAFAVPLGAATVFGAHFTRCALTDPPRTRRRLCRS